MIYLIRYLNTFNYVKYDVNKFTWKCNTILIDVTQKSLELTSTYKTAKYTQKFLDILTNDFKMCTQQLV